MTPLRILQVGLPFGNRVYIATAFTAVVVTGEPTIVGPAIVGRSVLPLSEHITRGAADLVRSLNDGKARTVSPRPSLLLPPPQPCVGGDPLAVALSDRSAPAQTRT